MLLCMVNPVIQFDADTGGNGEMLSRWEKRTYVPKWVVQKGFKKCVMGQELI